MMVWVVETDETERAICPVEGSVWLVNYMQLRVHAGVGGADTVEKSG